MTRIWGSFSWMAILAVFAWGCDLESLTGEDDAGIGGGDGGGTAGGDGSGQAGRDGGGVGGRDGGGIAGHDGGGRAGADGGDGIDGGMGGGDGGDGVDGGVGGGDGGDIEAECTEACELMVGCFDFDEVPAPDIDTCIEGCVADGPNEALDCVVDAEECAEVYDCLGLDPDAVAACGEACARYLECFDGEGEIDIGECVNGCAGEASPEERDCFVEAAECEDFDLCFGDEPIDPELEARCIAACDTVGQCILEAELEIPMDGCLEACIDDEGDRLLCVEDVEGCDEVLACAGVDEESVARCAQACESVLVCIGDEEPDSMASCMGECIGEIDSPELACVVEADGDCDAVLVCIEGDPDLEAECAFACSALLECWGEADPEALDDCVMGCVEESTAEERMCIQDAADCDEIGACVGGDEPGDCQAACVNLVALQCVDVELEDCVAGCEAEGSSEEIRCAIEESSCEQIEACIAGGGGEVDAETCSAACDVLLECFQVPPEDFDAEHAQCVEDCTVESTLDEVGCVIDAADCDVLEACFQ